MSRETIETSSVRLGVYTFYARAVSVAVVTVTICLAVLNQVSRKLFIHTYHTNTMENG